MLSLAQHIDARCAASLFQSGSQRDGGACPLEAHFEGGWDVRGGLELRVAIAVMLESNEVLAILQKLSERKS